MLIYVLVLLLLNVGIALGVMGIVLYIGWAELSDLWVPIIGFSAWIITHGLGAAAVIRMLGS